MRVQRRWLARGGSAHPNSGWRAGCRWLNALFAPLAGGPLDPFLGFQYSASSMAPGDARRLLSNNFEAEPWQVVFEIHTVFSKALGMIHPVTKEPLLPRLNNSLPVPLLAFAGECDLQFSTAAVARTAHHLAAVNSNQVPAPAPPAHAARGSRSADPRGARRQYVRVVVPGHGTEVCYGHYDLLLGRHAHEHVFKPLERWLSEARLSPPPPPRPARARPPALRAPVPGRWGGSTLRRAGRRSWSGPGRAARRAGEGVTARGARASRRSTSANTGTLQSITRSCRARWCRCRRTAPPRRTPPRT